MTYIVKPDAGAMGRGIYLVQREEDLDLTNPDFNGWVVQEYVQVHSQSKLQLPPERGRAPRGMPVVRTP